MKKFGKFLLKALCVYAIWDLLVLAWFGVTRIMDIQVSNDKNGFGTGPYAIASDTIYEACDSCKEWYNHFFK